MERLHFCGGQDLKGMLAAATVCLERAAELINSLNVFPVPDGDTGTNMLLTMRATVEEAHSSPDESASAVARAMAKGALMGARGNSGVILSQILRGLAKGLEEKDFFSGNELAAALAEASSMAYKGMSKPVEGTILTVIREASLAAQKMAAADINDVAAIMEAAVKEAKASVARTPTLLPVLRDAGVVDAGGEGLYVILEGALGYLKGELGGGEYKGAEIETAAPALSLAGMAEEPIYGYCTEFLLQGKDLDLEQVRAKLETMGESVLVVGDETTIRAHLHTFDPGAALSYATSLGTLGKVKVENMQDQHRDFVAAQPQKPALPVSDISTVSVATGEGLIRVFRSIGATAIVPGGHTMNPSVQELHRAVESVPSEKVIILPNNPNVILAAKQVQSLTRKEVTVVPTETIPQGIAALLAFNYEADMATNVNSMQEARLTVRTVEITTAVRSMRAGGLAIKEGQAIGFIDGELVAAGDSTPVVLYELLVKMGLEKGGLVTIHYGADVSSAHVDEIADSIRQKWPDVEVEVVNGGQPHYRYIVSVE